MRSLSLILHRRRRRRCGKSSRATPAGKVAKWRDSRRHPLSLSTPRSLSWGYLELRSPRDEMESLPFAQKQQQQQQQQLLGGEEQAPSDASTAIHSSLSDAVNSSLFWHQTPRSCQVSPPYQHPTFAPCPYASTLSASASTDSASYTPFAPVALQGLTVPQVLHIILPSTPPLPKSSSSVTSLPTVRHFPVAS